MPVFAFFFLEYSRYSPLFNFRIMRPLALTKKRCSAADLFMRFARPAGFSGGAAAGRAASFFCGRSSLPRERTVRRRRVTFPLQRPARRARPRGRFFSRMRLPSFVIAFRFLPCTGRSLTRARRPQLYARSSRLRKADRDRLLDRGGTVLPFPDVMHFLTYEFSGLRAWRSSFARVFVSSFDRFPFRHGNLRLLA